MRLLTTLKYFMMWWTYWGMGLTGCQWEWQGSGHFIWVGFLDQGVVASWLVSGVDLHVTTKWSFGLGYDFAISYFRCMRVSNCKIVITCLFDLLIFVGLNIKQLGTTVDSTNRSKFGFLRLLLANIDPIWVLDTSFYHHNANPLSNLIYLIVLL